MLAITACVGQKDAAQSALPTATQQVVVGDEPEPTNSPVADEPQVVLFEPPDLNSAEVVAPGQFTIDALAAIRPESQLFGVPYNPMIQCRSTACPPSPRHICRPIECGDAVPSTTTCNYVFSS